MTILLVPIRYSPHIGGIERLLEHTMPTLRDLGHEFVVITGNDSDTEQSDTVDGVPVYRLPFDRVLREPTPGAMLAIGGRIREIERDHDVHLRHVHGLDGNLWFVVRAHRRRPLPLVMTVHGTLDPPHPYSHVTKEALLTADAVTAVSGGVRTSLETTVPELHGRVEVIRNGITIPVPGADAARPVPVPGRIVMAGRLDWLKGFDLVIRAVAALQSVHPAVHVRIAGTGREAPRLRGLARAAGVADRVELLGPCSHAQVLDEFAQASVVVVPSRAIEGFSLVALEAATLGRPVVAAAVGGLTETVVDGVTGELVTPDDVPALTSALARLLAAPTRAEAMGIAARAHAEHYDATQCARGYARVYDRLDAARETAVASPTGTS